MALRKCVVCGKLFEVPKGNAKYCSQACRAIGTEQKRKEWESKTDYVAKQRERTARYREKRNAELALEAEQQLKKESAERKRLERKEAAKKRRQSQRKLAAGDPLTTMIHALQEGDKRLYLKAFQEYELSALQAENKPKRAVNGISVNDPDFVENAYRAVTESGIIYISMVSK